MFLTRIIRKLWAQKLKKFKNNDLIFVLSLDKNTAVSYN